MIQIEQRPAMHPFEPAPSEFFLQLLQREVGQVIAFGCIEGDERANEAAYAWIYRRGRVFRRRRRLLTALFLPDFGCMERRKGGLK